MPRSSVTFIHTDLRQIHFDQNYLHRTDQKTVYAKFNDIFCVVFVNFLTLDVM